MTRKDLQAYNDYLLVKILLECGLRDTDIETFYGIGTNYQKSLIEYFG